MKQILILLVAVAFLQAGSIEKFAKKHSYETNYKEAIERAKKEHKAIFLLQVSNYCPWCKKLEKKVLGSHKVDAVIQKNYIPLVLNRDKKEYPEQFGTPIVPVSYIIDYRDEKHFKLLRGYKSKSDMLYFLEKALK